MSIQTKCGYIAIIGRPNVGKSTLLNRLLGQKISITSRKPQTTQRQILGIKTQGDTQAVYVDTPGLQQKHKQALHRVMNRAARSALHDVDVVVWMIDARRFTPEDAWVGQLLEDIKCPVILVLNKVDLVKDKKTLLPRMVKFTETQQFKHVMPMSVKHNQNVEELESIIHELLPPSPHFFPEDQITDRDTSFRISEIIREKIMRVTGEEVPYGAAVVVESCKREDKIIHINVIIWVERPGQKPILIGKKGCKLKEIGSKARLDLEKMLSSKVFLRLWVKVKTGWSDSQSALQTLGFEA